MGRPKYLIMDQLKDKFFVSISGCHVWTGNVSKNGYGKLFHMGETLLAHRQAHIVYKGGIPDGLQVDHKCRNRLCINPDHLEAVTQRENIIRGEGLASVNSKKIICKRGHPLHPYTPGKIRRCRVCHAEAEAKRREFKRAGV